VRCAPTVPRAGVGGKTARVAGTLSGARTVVPPQPHVIAAPHRPYRRRARGVKMPAQGRRVRALRSRGYAAPPVPCARHSARPIAQGPGCGDGCAPAHHARGAEEAVPGVDPGGTNALCGPPRRMPLPGVPRGQSLLGQGFGAAAPDTLFALRLLAVFFLGLQHRLRFIAFDQVDLLPLRH
jgi:hypothetical protein